MIQKEGRGQASLEYLITIGFVTFLVIIVFAVAYLYIGILQPKIRINQVDAFAKKILSSAESVYYSGEPSKTAVEVYLPAGVNYIMINDSLLIINYSTGANNILRAYNSNVNITGSIHPAPGIKRLVLEAKTNYVDIHQ